LFSKTTTTTWSGAKVGEAVGGALVPAPTDGVPVEDGPAEPVGAAAGAARPHPAAASPSRSSRAAAIPRTVATDPLKHSGRRAARGYRVDFGSRAPRSASPNRFTVSISVSRATPGANM